MGSTRSKRKTRSFSPAELVIAIAVILTAIVIISQVFIFLNQNYKVLTGYLQSFLKGREIIEYIARDCRMAVRIMEEYSIYTTGDSCLILKTPSIDASGDVVDVNKDFDYIIYRIDDSGSLWKTVLPGPNSARETQDTVMKKSIGNLYFTHGGTFLSSIEHKSALTCVTLQVMTGDTIPGQRYSVNPGTTVKLMNYEWEYVR